MVAQVLVMCWSVLSATVARYCQSSSTVSSQYSSATSPLVDIEVLGGQQGWGKVVRCNFSGIIQCLLASLRQDVGTVSS